MTQPGNETSINDQNPSRSSFSSPLAKKSSRGARDEAGDEVHGAEHVHEEREVPVVRAHCGEHAHAPGFQIMSMMIRSRTAEVRACRRTPREVRLSARSSAFGPFFPPA